MRVLFATLSLAILALTSCARSGGLIGADSAAVDVRESRSGGSPTGSSHIPASEMSSRYDELLEYRAQPLTVYGSTQSEANQAALVLRGQGFQAVSTKVYP